MFKPPDLVLDVCTLVLCLLELVVQVVTGKSQLLDLGYFLRVGLVSDLQLLLCEVEQSELRVHIADFLLSLLQFFSQFIIVCGRDGHSFWLGFSTLQLFQLLLHVVHFICVVHLLLDRLLVLPVQFIVAVVHSLQFSLQLFNCDLGDLLRLGLLAHLQFCLQCLYLAHGLFEPLL